MEQIEYLARIADVGEFMPILAVDRMDALRQLTDVNLDSLYMESQSQETSISDKSKYNSHVVKLKDGSYYLMEAGPRPAFEKEDIEKVYVGVEMD